MSKTLFANSKTALVFAAMTIISALMVVGSYDGGGMLDGMTDRLAKKTEIAAEEALPNSEAPAEETEQVEPLDPASGWGGTDNTEFGDYYPEDAGAEPSAMEEPAGDPYNTPEPVGDHGFADQSG